MLKMERNIVIFGLSNMLFSHRHRASFPGPRLALDCVSPQFVDNCAQGLQTDQKLLDARQELQNITAAAIRKQIEVQEAYDELESREFFGSRIVNKVEEKKMYKPLVCL
jgi:hypothetical protein